MPRFAPPGIATAIRAKVAIAIGTLIRKIARHETAVTSQPPRGGPSRKAIPVQAVQVPIAAPRSSPSKDTVIVASAAGVRSAPATPWRPRPTISVVPSQASAQSTEVTAKATTPITNTRFSP